MSTPSRRASQSSGKSRKKDVTLDLSTTRQMLPLVKSIVADIVGTKQRLTKLVPEQETLERNRRSLGWVERQRRYSITDEIAQAERNLTGAVTELDALGLTLVNDVMGQVDFPTRINGRPAAFSWQLGEEGVAHWHYTGELQRRPIPSDWQQGTPLRVRGEA